MDQEKKKKKPSRIDKEIYWIFGVMALIVVVFIIFFFIFHSLRTFEYKGLTFTKDTAGPVTFYQYYYSLMTREGKIRQFTLNLRVDPRKNNVPIEGEIFFKRNTFVYVTINETGLAQCPNAQPAVGTLATFIVGNDFDMEGGTPDQKEAEEKGRKYVTCENRPERIVILIQQGNETRITKENNCHIMNINNCELNLAIEKFMVQAIIDGKNRTVQPFP